MPAETPSSVIDVEDEEGLVRLCSDIPTETLAAELKTGNDPLGSAFSRIRPAAVRRKSGATYTPTEVVDAMVARLRTNYPDPARIVDCGAGSGRFSLALARAYPNASVLAVEADPLAATILRSNVSAAGLQSRIRIIEGDFRTSAIPGIAGQTLFVGNPPYVRHHDIDAAGKEWFDRTSESLGVAISRLSGLHVHFFMRVAQLARKGDAGMFITSAEWLDSASGRGLRELVSNRLGASEVFVVDPSTSLFDDAQVSSAIAEFEIGNCAGTIRISPISTISELAVSARNSETMARSDAAERRWSCSADAGLSEGMCRLGQMFSVHRGQVTGANGVWIVSKDTPTLPERFLVPCVTKATDLIAADAEITDSTALRRVIQLPAVMDDIDLDERDQVEAFLRWAEAKGAMETFTARARKRWWALSFKAPAPILCTYMGRRPPVFVRNTAGVAHLNISHGLYPRGKMTEAEIDRVAAWLAANPVLQGGKTYGGGLRKFEPRDIERIAVPLCLFG